MQFKSFNELALQSWYTSYLYAMLFKYGKGRHDLWGYFNKTNYYSIALVRYKIVNGKRGATPLVGYIYYDHILCMLIK